MPESNPNENIPERTIEGETLPALLAAPAIAHTSNPSPAFDVRDYGWENISLPVPNNVEQALSEAHLNWLVLPRKVYVDGAVVPKRVANVRNDKPAGENVLEIVGSKYHIVQNHEALGFVQDVLNLNTVKLIRAGSFDGGRTVFLLGSTEGFVVEGDKIESYLLFSNSHDGSSSVRVALTNVRVYCKNTLSLALKTAPRVWSVHHTKSSTERMKAAQASMNFIGNYLTAVPMLIERMVDTPISDKAFAEIAEDLFPIPVKTERNTRVVENAKEARATFELIYDETPDLNSIRGTAWGVYNAFSDWVSHKPAIRETPNYEVNRFVRTIEGRSLDRAKEIILAAA